MKDLSHYCSFKGTASRSEYWGVQLINVLIIIVYMFVIAGLAMMFQPDMQAPMFALMLIPALLLTMLVQWATAIRRLRDAGINPWFALCLLIPYIGVLLVILYGALPTSVEENK